MRQPPVSHSPPDPRPSCWQVVINDLIPKETWSAARRQLMMRLGAVQQAALGYSPARAANLVGGGQAEAVAAQKATGTLPEVTALFEPIRPILEHALGTPLERAAGGQMALNFPTEAGEGINETGWKDTETPFFGWGGHVDGVWNGGTQIPQSPEATDEEKWYSDPSTNGGSRFYPADLGHGEDACLSNFTVLIGVPLSDMSEEGSGNVGLLRGSCHDMEAFLRKQTELGGPLGPSGPEWPREYTNARNGHGLCHYPPAVRQAAAEREGYETTDDGRERPSAPSVVSPLLGTES